MPTDLPPLERGARIVALAAATGCAAFVGTWATAGAVTPGYSPVHDAISRLAADGAAHRHVVGGVMAAYGSGLVAFGLVPLRAAVPGWAWAATALSGAATVGVAATPLGSPARDAAHLAFAAVGYATLAAGPLLAARAWARQPGRAHWSRRSAGLGVASGVALAASTLGPASGLLQRTGITLGDAWVVVVAAGLLRAAPRLAGAPRSSRR